MQSGGLQRNAKLPTAPRGEKIPRAVRRTAGRPVIRKFSAARLMISRKNGGILYNEHNCAGCHGADVENASGVAKDLRFGSAQTHREFAAIVIGGLRHDKGMPAFTDVTANEARAIQAYVINQAWNGYNSQVPAGRDRR
jgi:mono/diheme cytochrome c family protein